MFKIKAFNVHATWRTKSGRKGELKRSYIGETAKDVHDKVLRHLKADSRFDARHELDVQVWENKPATTEK
jgi:hypothetical protein